MYEQRLAIAHAEIDNTVSSYISFVTGHCGEDFEKAMAECSALAVHARKMLSERESLELELVGLPPPQQTDVSTDILDGMLKVLTGQLQTDTYEIFLLC
jgi:hypothetical protein